MPQQKNPAFDEELVKMESVLVYLKQYLNIMMAEKSVIDEKVDYSIRHFNSDNAEQFIELTINVNSQNYFGQKINGALRGLKVPYFARVDFTADEDGIEQRLYIGKMTLMDKDDKEMLIVDWRAPISSLYYEGRLGAASYLCPDGEISGEITLKRQFVIENAQLKDVMDIDITTNDEFLQAALGSSKDNRLKDIVSTIQSEQNKIIRADMYKPLIVQGAAGGGKTTIALHRIAYLLYAYEKKLTAKNFMIMAPSKFFLSYISGVLPDLGVENVVQTTFEDFARKVINKNIKIKPSVETLAHVIENFDYDYDGLRISRLKSSLVYKDVIEQYFDFILQTILPKGDFEIDGFVLIPLKDIKQLFLKAYSYLPVSARLAEIRKNLTNTLTREKPKILQQIDEKYDTIKIEIKKELPDCDLRRKKIIELLDERDSIMNSIKRKSKGLIKKYLDSFKLQPTVNYYYLLMKNSELFFKLSRGAFSSEECSGIISHTLDSFRKKTMETEDLAPLMLLQFKLYGMEEDIPIKHIVIDEAQDFSMFQFYVLKLITGTDSFSILGDLFQGIYSYKGVESWEEVREDIFDKGDYLTLEQSYRTTVEIMDKANETADKLHFQAIPKARPVIRHGDDVQTLLKSGMEEIALDMESKILDYRNRGYKSIAIICKTMQECELLQSLFKEEVKVITGNETDFTEGIKIIPSYHVKGLEFDVVFISDASKEKYRDNELDTKLLYIAMTRALHQLVVYYCVHV